MKRTVHIYAEVRVKVTSIESTSQEDAIRQADELPLFKVLTRPHPFTGWGKEIDYIEYADVVHGYLVDDDDDEDFENSCGYDAEGKPICDADGSPLPDPLKDVLEALKEVVSQYGFDALGPGCKLKVTRAIDKAEGGDNG